MVNKMMTVDEMIIAIKEKIKLTDEQVKKEMESLYNELKGMEFPDKTPEETEKIKREMVKRRFVLQYRKELGVKSDTFEGIFIGVTSALDTIAKQRKEAIDAFKKDPEETVKKGITDENGTPLYYVPESKLDGMPPWAKKRLGMPLPKENIQRLAIGLVSMTDKKTKDSKTLPMNFSIRADNVKTIVPRFHQLKFNGLATPKSTEELAYINDAGGLNIQLDKRLTDVEVATLFGKYFPEHIIKINQLEKFIEEHTLKDGSGRQEFNRFAIIKAEVVRINTTPSSTGSIGINISDETSEWFDGEGNVNPGVTCWVPADVTIDFAERSEVWIVGQPAKGQRGININVLGIYTPTIYRNLVPQTKSLSPSKEEGSDDSDVDW